ncbi:DUF1501 domain-containing protein [Planctomicrobium sp. SH527]|uniref:DUF1501 domain-containing protein n=1 Tax=Planctomicrobium sp. SH527 TaxID=3448123 RepID=UPI003F5B303C
MKTAEGVSTLTQVSRRGFLAVGGASVVGISLKSALAARAGKAGAVIQIVLNGGASHLDLFDPKPLAPREYRGPMHSIATRIPSIRFSECLPRLADRADRLVIVRSLFHDAAPIHETGLQLLETGRLVTRREQPVPVSVLLEDHFQSRKRSPISVLLSDPVVEPAGNISVSNETATSTRRRAATLAELTAQGFSIPDYQSATARVKDSYGSGEFARKFWSAARLVERGVMHIQLNTFDVLDGQRTWDAHGDQEIGPANIFDYRDSLGPQLDQAFSALIDDLQSSGLLQQTLILCTGEMGRNPRLNEDGGRDHWTQAWSGILVGGGLEGGQVIGETDEYGETITSDPLPVSQLPMMALNFLGVPTSTDEIA